MYYKAVETNSLNSFILNKRLLFSSPFKPSKKKKKKKACSISDI